MKQSQTTWTAHTVFIISWVQGLSKHSWILPSFLLALNHKSQVVTNHKKARPSPKSQKPLQSSTLRKSGKSLWSTRQKFLRVTDGERSYRKTFNLRIGAFCNRIKTLPLIKHPRLKDKKQLCAYILFLSPLSLILSFIIFNILFISHPDSSHTAALTYHISHVLTQTKPLRDPNMHTQCPASPKLS